MPTTIRMRRGTAAQWTAANPVLAAGEAGVETDTGRMKVGDGATAWNSRRYADGPSDTSTDNAIARFDGTQGRLQSSPVSIADDGRIDGGYTASAGNLLPANVATGTDTLATTAGFSPAGITVERDATTAAEGEGSLKAVFVAGSPALWVGGSASAGSIPIKPGAPYTLSAAVRSAHLASVGFRVQWWRADGDAASTASTHLANLPVTASWVTHQSVLVAPPDATFASIRLLVASMAAGDTIHYDKIGFWQGAWGTWQPPGTPIPHLGSWITEAAATGRAGYVWDTINARAQMVYYDSGWRDISSLLANGWTGQLFVRRTDNVVLLRSAGLSGAGATADTVATLPTGFRSESTINQILPANATDATVLRAQMTSAGAIILPRAVATAVSSTWPMSTTNALPTALPGDPVGTIPAA